VKVSFFTVLAIGATSSLLFAFQNCAGPLQLDSRDHSQSTNASTTSNVANGGTVTPTSALPTQQCMIIFTTGSVWTVPGDWNSSDNTIEAVGNGSDGGGNVRGGGGGGAYAKSVNVALTPHAQVAYNLAHIAITLGAGNSSGDVYLCRGTSGCSSLTDTSVVVSAQGGKGSTNGANLDSLGGLGGQASAGIATGPGAVKYSGGTGGDCSEATCSNFVSPGGGGGAAGPHGNGVSAGTAGGAGDNGTGGGGGAAGADSGFTGVAGTVGANGTECDNSHGIGGGGGAGGYGSAGGNGGNFGGGGAGSGANYYSNTTGGGGMIVVKYMGTTCN
jgi:hypothetical protein